MSERISPFDLRGLRDGINGLEESLVSNISKSILSLDLRGLTDGTDGLEDVLVNLIGLGFGFEKSNEYYLSVNKIPENWTIDPWSDEPNCNDIRDDKGNFRIHCEPGKTILRPRFSLSQRKSRLFLLDEEMGDGFSPMIAAEFPITLRFYHANRVEVNAIIDAHLPNLSDPFDHWAQDRTRAIESLQKELRILVQSIPKKPFLKKNTPLIAP